MADTEISSLKPFIAYSCAHKFEHKFPFYVGEKNMLYLSPALYPVK